MDNVRGIAPPTPPVGGSALLRPPDLVSKRSNDFAAELRRATEDLAVLEAPVTPQTLFDVDPQVYIEQAMASMQRAGAHIRAAREYFRGAGSAGGSALDVRG